MNLSATYARIEGRLQDPLAGLGAGGIGFVGPDVPIDLLLASRRPFGHLPWRAAGKTLWADRWLESSFPFWARSILEQWHDGSFDEIDTVVFSRADDACQRLYYYVRELRQRGKLAGPRPIIFDIALARRESSIRHTETEIACLMETVDVSDAALADGIVRANDLRRRLLAIDCGRVGNGPLYERFARAVLFGDPTAWVDRIVLPEAETGRARILLAGSMPVDERLHEAVEISGASIVAESHALAPGCFGPEFVPADEPIRLALAAHLHRHSVAPRAFIDRAEHVLARARQARADAVILWLTREDEALSWSVPALRRALEAAGFPVLLLPVARWRADDGALDAITDFARGAFRASA